MRILVRLLCYHAVFFSNVVVILGHCAKILYFVCVRAVEETPFEAVQSDVTDLTGSQLEGKDGFAELIHHRCARNKAIVSAQRYRDFIPEHFRYRVHGQISETRHGVHI